MHAKSLPSCPTLCSPMNCCPPGSSSTGFSRQYLSGSPCPPYWLSLKEKDKQEFFWYFHLTFGKEACPPQKCEWGVTCLLLLLAVWREGRCCWAGFWICFYLNAEGRWLSHLSALFWIKEVRFSHHSGKTWSLFVATELALLKMKLKHSHIWSVQWHCRNTQRTIS